MSGGHMGLPMRGGTLTFAEIARRLGISEAEAYAAYRHGLSKLRRKRGAVAVLSFYSSQLQLLRTNARKVA
jgi:hypothetical protein